MVRYIRAKAPLRIAFSGDGTDIDPYAADNGGRVVSAAINKYAYCTLTARDDMTMSIRSTYYGRYKAPLNEPLKLDGNNDLIKAVSNYFDIKKGFEMLLHMDVPAGSGLGGSSAMMLAMIAAVSNWIESDISRHDLAKLTYHLEREIIGLPGGRQDQYVSAMGGCNVLEFEGNHVEMSPINVDRDILNELQYRSVLGYVGRPRHTSEIIKNQVLDYLKGLNTDVLNDSKVLATDLAECLRLGELDRMGEIIDKSWECKKRLSDNVTNHEVDKMIRIGKMNGAIGGKLTGAGGGGFLYLLCEYDLKVQVVEALKAKGAMLTDFMFEPRGVISWRNSNE